ncbi:MAG: hypothetical protein OQJ99_11130 [Rhodospirillales bacterium]|nr:hypothetical protein [Rhodospirillales bacterium]MCW8860990.1 hypothetical protein [Rhodospirillales bacterium]MCW8952017.1 hypothetical protein [Rhodospirillales bacterium]
MDPTRMNVETLDPDVLEEACNRIVPRPDAEILVDTINNRAQGIRFHLAHTDDGWYRLGGVVDDDGNRVAQDLAAWAEAESAGDVMDLVTRFGESGYLATAVHGKTHYLIAPIGDGPLDFAQIEVEELKEVVERPLFEDGVIPDTLEDVIDPVHFAPAKPQVVRPARYLFKRITFFPDRADDMISEFRGDPRFRRFLDEWQTCEGSKNLRFCDHWVVRVVPYMDSTGNHQNEVRLLSTRTAAVATIRRTKPAEGPVLAELLRSIDSHAGFDMAWYFMMLVRNFLPYRLVQVVHEDQKNGGGVYGRIPTSDMKTLARWIEDPYHL